MLASKFFAGVGIIVFALLLVAFPAGAQWVSVFGPEWFTRDSAGGTISFGMFFTGLMVFALLVSCFVFCIVKWNQDDTRRTDS